MNRQLKLGKGLVVLACLMVLLCINQRAVGERLFAHFSPQEPVVQMQSNGQSMVFKTAVSSEKSAHLSSCELSAKSLLTLSPAAIEPLFFVFLSITALGIFTLIYFHAELSVRINIPHQELGSIYNIAIFEIRTPSRSACWCILFWRNYAFLINALIILSALFSGVLQAADTGWLTDKHNDHAQVRLLSASQKMGRLLYCWMYNYKMVGKPIGVLQEKAVLRRKSIGNHQ